jgi:hypothetical protein
MGQLRRTPPVRFLLHRTEDVGNLKEASQKAFMPIRHCSFVDHGCSS